MSSTGLAIEVEHGQQHDLSGPTRWQLLFLFALVALLYHDIALRMAHQWWVDPNFSHGIFVPFFTAFVVFQRRRELAQIPVRPSWLGLPVILSGLAACVVGVLGSENFISRSSLVLLLGGLVIFFWGWQYLRALLFPWLFLLLMVPIPNIVFNQITLPLQFLASKLAAATLTTVGVPVLREGNILNLPRMPLEVVEACSGIRSLMSLGAMAIIYGYFLEPKFWRRLLLALFSVPIAVGANAFRIVGTGLTVQYWDPEKAQGFFHEFSGWVIFVSSLVMVVALHRLLSAVRPHKVEHT